MEKDEFNSAMLLQQQKQGLNEAEKQDMELSKKKRKKKEERAACCCCWLADLLPALTVATHSRGTARSASPPLFSAYTWGPVCCCSPWLQGLATLFFSFGRVSRPLDAISRQPLLLLFQTRDSSRAKEKDLAGGVGRACARFTHSPYKQEKRKEKEFTSRLV